MSSTHTADTVILQLQSGNWIQHEPHPHLGNDRVHILRQYIADGLMHRSVISNAIHKGICTYAQKCHEEQDAITHIHCNHVIYASYYGILTTQQAVKIVGSQNITNTLKHDAEGLLTRYMSEIIPAETEDE